MPEIDGITNTEITLPVRIFGHTLLITYRPFVPYELNLDAVETKQDQHEQIVKFFCAIVQAWDAQINGEVIPINEKSLRFGGPVPTEVLAAIIGAVTEDKEIMTKKIRQNVYDHRISEISAEQRNAAAQLRDEDGTAE